MKYRYLISVFVFLSLISGCIDNNSSNNSDSEIEIKYHSEEITGSFEENVQDVSTMRQYRVDFNVTYDNILNILMFLHKSS